MIFKILLLTVAAVAAVPLGVEQKWADFKLTHDKVYEDQNEENYRFQVFLENLKEVEEHNAKYEAGLTTWYKGIDEFSDMTQEEFEKIMSCSDFDDLEVPEDEQMVSEALNAPSSLDYRSSFNPVRNQGRYLTCYAFAALATIEAYRNRAGYQKQILSPQEVIDCSKGAPYFNNGSYRGDRGRTMLYVKNEGVMLERDYPYTGSENPCGHDSRRVALRINGHNYIRNTVANLKNVLYNTGPIAVSVYAKEWRGYRGGVFRPTRVFNGTTGHSVVLVGYGTSNSGEDYWLLRNSYGPNWGESGHIRVTREIINGNIHIGLGGPLSKSGVTPNI